MTKTIAARAIKPKARITKVLFICLAVWSVNAQAASTFQFTNGCSMVCSGDWGVGSTPGTVTCHGTVTSKSSACPRIVKQISDQVMNMRNEKKVTFSLSGNPEMTASEKPVISENRASKP